MRPRRASVAAVLLALACGESTDLAGRAPGPANPAHDEVRSGPLLDLLAPAEAERWSADRSIAKLQSTARGLEVTANGPDPLLSRRLELSTTDLGEIRIGTLESVHEPLQLYLSSRSLPNPRRVDTRPSTDGRTHTADLRDLGWALGRLGSLGIALPGSGRFTLTSLEGRERPSHGLHAVAEESRECLRSDSLRAPLSTPAGATIVLEFALPPGRSTEPRVGELAVAFLDREGRRVGTSLGRIALEPGRWMQQRIVAGFHEPEEAARLEASLRDVETGGSETACWVAPRLAKRDREGQGPNVLLFSLDTFRADRLEHAPFLRRQAAEGLRATRTWSSSSWTLPSHVSLFTSTNPIEHDTPRAGIPLPYSGARIPEGLVTLAEAFRRAGHATAATTDGAYLSPVYGFARGFERYRAATQAAASDSFHEHEGFVDRFLEERDGRPFFLFVHTYKIHDYFLNTPEYHAFVDPVKDRAHLDHGSWLNEIRAGEAPADYVSRLYDAGVRVTDAFVERLVERVERATEGEDLLVVVTSDHGESFGEHPNAWHHGTALWEEQLRVPLIAWGNHRDAPRGEIDRPVSLIDVAPSLLAAAGIAVPDTFRGRSDLFRPGAEAEAGDARDPMIFASAVQTTADPDVSRVNQVVISGGWKYLRSDSFLGQTSIEKCFDLRSDPGEKVNRLASPSPCAHFPEIIAARMEASIPDALFMKSDAPIRITFAPRDRGRAAAVRRATAAPSGIRQGEDGSLSWTPQSDGEVLAILFTEKPESVVEVELDGRLVGREIVWSAIGGAGDPTRLGGDEGFVTLFRTPNRHRESERGESDRAFSDAELMEQLQALGYVE